MVDPIKVAQLLVDEYSAKILIALHEKTLSADELIKQRSIPSAACYRKIKELLEAGLIKEVDRVLTKRGRRKSIYTSNLKEAIIHFKDGKLRFMFVLSSGKEKRFKI